MLFDVRLKFTHGVNTGIQQGISIRITHHYTTPQKSTTSLSIQAHPAAQIAPRMLLPLGPHRLLLALLTRGRRALAGIQAMSSAAPAPAQGSRRPLRGVVFDMDGTLTVPVIDFPAMYREVLGGDAAYAAARAAGGGSIDILHCIEGWAPDKQRHAYEVIARFEKEGLDRLQIMPGERPLRLLPCCWVLVSSAGAVLCWFGLSSVWDCL